MEYKPQDIEPKWRRYWAQHKTFSAAEHSDKPKYYVLDMFPYPSGAGLHVGHPLGYIASDIVARYRRLLGYNVLHPMGYDSFGLPAEQYAIQTGQHPAVTTARNIERYREQLDKIGFSFDWDREVRTSDPAYYKWTQWIFIQLFNSWYNPVQQKAESIETLIHIFEKEGFKGSDDEMLHGGIEKSIAPFTAKEWQHFGEKERLSILMNFRLAYLDDSWVNWCPALGTVLANDEVKDGVSERGGHPVERKLMKQWSLRITAYAERLLSGLDTVDWVESLKETQRHWIGKSEGCSLHFALETHSHAQIEVFTTRPDTLFGVSFICLAPEHELASSLATAEYREAVETYITYAKNRSERERQADVKTVTGQFTGSYAVHPFTGKPVPVWIADYVLSGYGTGAVMGVPAHDSRDYAFAHHFGLPVTQVIEGGDISQAAYEAKEGRLIASGFLDGLSVKEAMSRVLEEVEKRGIGQRKINYRLRDAVFGRQRYWGEPIPVYYRDGIPYTVAEEDLPVTLPEIDKFLPTESGEPPLARAGSWKYQGQYEYEHTTMPGWAGSSWYFLRYMDPHNDKAFASPEALAYWKEVDLYIGGAEHATGHLLYFRFWTKFLKDRGWISIEEPVRKLINQGMIQGVSDKIYMSREARQHIDLYTLQEGVSAKQVKASEKLVTVFVSADIYCKHIEFTPDDNFTAINVPIELVSENRVDLTRLIAERQEYQEAVFITGNGSYWKNGKLYGKQGELSSVTEAVHFLSFNEVEKMSKSKWNVVNPDEIIAVYGADTLRLYEMFLGPIEQHKPWDTKGIEGTSRFLKKCWRLFHSGDTFSVSEEAPEKTELKALHKMLKRVSEDIERYSFNTVVSALMIGVNELSDLRCHKRAILEPLVIALSPYAPHIAEELWEKLGHTGSVAHAQWPAYDESHLVEDAFAYPVQFNGKTRFNLELPLNLQPAEVEKAVLSAAQTLKYLEGRTPKKVIVVPGRIINVVG